MDRISHMTTELRMDGNNVYGKAIFLSQITLFLDIDGVLNNKKSLKQFGHIADFHSAINSNRPFEKSRINFDSECVKRVKLLQESYDMDVVICSNWRFGSYPKHFKQLFDIYDWNLDRICLVDTMIGESPSFNRSQIIEKYIKENDITRFIIFDDTSSHYTQYLNNLVLTDGELGFTENDFVRAKNILEKYI